MTSLNTLRVLITSSSRSGFTPIKVVTTLMQTEGLSCMSWRLLYMNFSWKWIKIKLG